MSNFPPREVVCRGSETQLQVGGNLNKIKAGKWLLQQTLLVDGSQCERRVDQLHRK